MTRKTKVRAVGIDVSAATVHLSAEGREPAVFNNTAAGHRKLIAYATKGGHHINVVLEATGTHHLDLAIALAKHARARVMVVNPRSAKSFHLAQNIRAKTDAVDADSLMSFAQRMPFEEWTCPSDTALALRGVTRLLDQLIKDQTRLKNRSSAAKVSTTTSPFVLRSLGAQLKAIGDEIILTKDAISELIESHEPTRSAVERIRTVPGLGALSAARLVSEFQFLDPSMSSKELVAWAGLDPRTRQSGTSLNGRAAISKRGNARVRHVLFMPAMVATRGKEGPLHALYQRIADRSGVKMKGVCAVMRKTLIYAWAIYRSDAGWRPELAQPRKKAPLAA